MAKRDAKELRDLLVPVYLPTALEFAGEAAFLPILPIIAIKLGFSVPESAALGLIGGILSVVGTVPVGKLMAAAGERTVILVTGILLVLTNLALGLLVGHGLSSEGGLWHRLGLVAALIVVSSCIIVWSLGRQSYLGTYLPTRIRARGMTALGGAMRLGQIVGPLLSSAVLWLGHASWVFYLYAALMVMATGCVWARMLETDSGDGRAAEAAPATTSPAEEGAGAVEEATAQGTAAHTDSGTVTGMLQRVLTFRDMLSVGLGVLPLTIARVNRPIIVPLIAAAMGLDETAVALIFGITSAIEILLFYPAGTIMDRWGRVAAIVPCMLIMAIGFLLMVPFAIGGAGVDVGGLAFWVLLGASLVMGVGNGLGSGIMMTLGVDMSNSATRTKDLARWNTLMGAGRLLGPLIVTLVAAYVAIGWAGALMAIILVAGGLWLAKVLPRYGLGLSK